jgi:hypothetical protein
MTRAALLSSPGARHLIQGAIEARNEGKRKRMRREALQAIWWYRNRSRAVEQLAFFVEDTWRPS